MKIVVTGGLGYVGCALIDTFREEFTKNPDLQVIVVDKEFIPQRVASLHGNNYNFRYVQADICDTIAMLEVVKDADIIYHLASPVEAESSVNREKETWETIRDATLRIASIKPERCLMLFASTANVFGGIIPEQDRSSNINLTEEDSPVPLYPYAQSKRVAEEALMKEEYKNVLICRFGTAYGYSDGIRFNLVTNIFFRKMMLGMPIEVYGDGTNYRPFCHVRDIARALRFLTSKYLSGEVKDKEIFHVVQTNMQIKDLAAVTASYNPECKIVFPPEKPAPFMSYHLSNKKIKELGFKFLENIKESTEEMLKIFEAMK